MIPGNIDLTENLDFRNVRLKEIPQLPDTWKGGNRLNVDSDHITSITSTSDSYRMYNNTGSTYQITTYHNTELSGWTTIQNEYDSIISDSDTSNFTLSYYYDNSISYNITTNTTFEITSTYNSSDKTRFSLTLKEPEYDVFGNKIQTYIEDIPKMPWNIEKNNYRSPRSIAWEYYTNWYDEEYEDDDIPWDSYDSIRSKRYDLNNKVNRAKNLISWLTDKTTSFIKNYFETEDDVNLSYLTNMSWIRIQDAVVDYIV